MEISSEEEEEEEVPLKRRPRSAPTESVALTTMEVMSTPEEKEVPGETMHEEEDKENKPSETNEKEVEEKPADEAEEEPTNKEEDVETSPTDQEGEDEKDTPLKSRLRSSRATDPVADPAEGPKESPSRGQPSASILPEEEEANEEEIDEVTYQREWKRNGKMPAKPVRKRIRRANPTVTISEPIQVPFGQKSREEKEMEEAEESSSGESYSMSTEVKNPADNVSLVDESEVLQPITYEKIVVEISEHLLKMMEKFNDPV